VTAYSRAGRIATTPAEGTVRSSRRAPSGINGIEMTEQQSIDCGSIDRSGQALRPWAAPPQGSDVESPKASQ
jgi:hypothetical protein